MDPLDVYGCGCSKTLGVLIRWMVVELVPITSFLVVTPPLLPGQKNKVVLLLLLCLQLSLQFNVGSFFSTHRGLSFCCLVAAFGGVVAEMA